MPWLNANTVEAQTPLCHNGETLFLRMEAVEADILATLTGPLPVISISAAIRLSLPIIRHGLP